MMLQHQIAARILDEVSIIHYGCVHWHTRINGYKCDVRDIGGNRLLDHVWFRLTAHSTELHTIWRQLITRSVITPTCSVDSAGSSIATGRVCPFFSSVVHRPPQNAITIFVRTARIASSKQNDRSTCEGVVINLRRETMELLCISITSPRDSDVDPL